MPEPDATNLEAVRRVLDPVQSGLVPAHVTLCREDELALVKPDDLASRLTGELVSPVTLHFGRPEVFHGHGILLPCIAGEQDFRSLREQVLGSSAIRRQFPHITLAHPRNPRSPGNSPANASVLPAEIRITFSTVSLIEQTGSTPWRELRTFEIGGDKATAGPGKKYPEGSPGYRPELEKLQAKHGARTVHE